MDKRNRGKEEEPFSSNNNNYRGEDTKRVMMHRPIDPSAIKYPPKPPANKQGRPLELTSNFYKVEIGKITLFQYHVDFKPEEDKIGRRFKLLGALDAQMSKDPKAPEKDRFLGLIAFDGSMLFAKKQIDFGAQKTEFRASVTYFENQYEVIIKLVKTIDNSRDIPEQFYNVLAKKFIRNLNLKRSKNKFYDVANQLTITDNNQKMNLWPCFDTKILPLQSGFALNLDVSFRILQGDTIMDIIEQTRRSARNNYQKAVENKLIGSSVIANYGRFNTWTIKEIHWDKNPDLKLDLRNKDGTARPVTIRQYMRERYKMLDNIPDQPLLLAEENLFGNKQRKPITGHLLPSLCTLAGFADAARDKSRERQIPAAARLEPKDRQRQVTKFYDRIYGQDRNKELMKEWGIKISPHTSTARAIELPLPQLKFANKVVTPKYGSWQGEMKEAHIWNKRLGNVGLIIPERSPFGDVNQIQRSISTVCKGLGVPEFTQTQNFIVFNIRDDHPQSYIDEVLKHGDKINLALICLPTNAEDRYSAIKRTLTCGNVPVATQCVVWGKKLGLSVWTNVVLQMCAKLGCVLWAMDYGFTAPTMVIGIDVNHSKNQPSIAGFVASISRSCAAYFSEIRQQDGKYDELVSMKDLAIKAIRAFYDANDQKYPEYVVVYRDGVGDSQMDAVKSIEVEALKEAFKACKINPKLVFLVVQKRTTSRFYSRGENPPPGTLLDTDLVDPVKYDFYMVAHTARQATVRPAHYFVIEDTTGWSAEYLQNLTYKFCHMYCNFSGAIAVPAPVKYAHKLAYQCGNHWSRELPNPKLATRLHFI